MLPSNLISVGTVHAVIMGAMDNHILDTSATLGDRTQLLAFIQDLGPRQQLNAYREGLGLPPSNNLISGMLHEHNDDQVERKSGSSAEYHQQTHMPAITYDHIPNLRNYGFIYPTEQLATQPIPLAPFFSSDNFQAGLFNESAIPKQRLSKKKYRGNQTLTQNKCADIPDSMNVRIWITCLPPTCTTSALLQSIHGIGEVYASHIKPPRVDGPLMEIGTHTSTASLTFFTEAAANTFMNQQVTQPLVIQGYRTMVVRHLIRTEPIPVNGQSRVLVIRGSHRVVNPDYLRMLFTNRWGIYYDTDFVTFTREKERGEVIWAFGSFRAQAHVVYRKLKRHLSNQISVSYAPDPCA
ncbi:hypothetical protein M426DRAFT_28803 [Hypoxylon sp. CI-4A]|nr:hypothetical protein M426DRAFT_28803 [Hypoxylon sp. CI-4A]